jgi:hypothetical protein
MVTSGPQRVISGNFQPQTKRQFVDGDVPLLCSAETSLQTLLCSISVGNTAIACGPSSLLGGTREQSVNLTAL